MKFTRSFLSASPLIAVALAKPVPTPTIQERSTTICGQWDTVVTGTYTVYDDFWGEANASSGSQCTTVDSVSDGTLVWSTSWTWAGGSSDVKSYANAVVTMDAQEISTITSIPTTWDWSYSGTSIVADVSYDMFTSSTASGSNEYEIMVWLAALGGAGPISATGSAIATTTISGVTFKLWYGLNGSTKVYSFVAESEATSFSSNLLLFFNYLESAEGFPSSQYLKNIGAGTEPFTGTNAVLSVSAYKTVVN
jgi:xyloglucan-specific endo-beta-1,4-glucanase